MNVTRLGNFENDGDDKGRELCGFYGLWTDFGDNLVVDACSFTRAANFLKMSFWISLLSPSPKLRKTNPFLIMSLGGHCLDFFLFILSELRTFFGDDCFERDLFLSVTSSLTSNVLTSTYLLFFYLFFLFLVLSKNLGVLYSNFFLLDVKH